MQPYGAGSWHRISHTAGTTVSLFAAPKVLEKVVMGSNSEGTVTFYDNASGTSSATECLVVDDAGVDFPQTLNCDFQLRNGLTYVAGGTVDVTLVVR